VRHVFVSLVGLRKGEGWARIETETERFCEGRCLVLLGRWGFAFSSESEAGVDLFLGEAGDHEEYFWEGVPGGAGSAGGVVEEGAEAGEGGGVVGGAGRLVFSLGR